MQAVFRTPNSEINLQNKSHLDDLNCSLHYAAKDLQFLLPKRVYNIQDDAESDALRSILTKQLQLHPEEIQIDGDILDSMYQ